MITREKAYALRAMIEKGSASLTDEDALDAVELYPKWAVGVDYTVGQRVRDGGKLYKCVQAHKSQSDWEPHAVPALWVEVSEPGKIDVWHQPTGVHDAYRIGDRVRYPDEQGAVWECTADYNVSAPGVYGWKEV